jgi:hypothetical protein
VITFLAPLLLDRTVDSKRTGNPRDEDNNEPGCWDNVPVVRMVGTIFKVNYQKKFNRFTGYPLLQIRNAGYFAG